jgi:hypothetical protein
VVHVRSIGLVCLTNESQTMKNHDLHPVELALLAGLLLLEALKPLLACVIALCLVLLGWRPPQKAPEQAPTVRTVSDNQPKPKRARRPRKAAVVEAA